MYIPNYMYIFLPVPLRQTRSGSLSLLLPRSSYYPSPLRGLRGWGAWLDCVGCCCLFSCLLFDVIYDVVVFSIELFVFEFGVFSP